MFDRTMVVSFLHLSVPPKMLNELLLTWHWLMSTLRKSMSIPLVPLQQDTMMSTKGHVVKHVEERTYFTLSS